MTDEYIAGFFDGEGSLFVSYIDDKYGIRTQPKLRMSNNCEEVLRVIQERTGGKVKKTGNTNKERLGYKETYYLEVLKRQDIVSVLKLMLPYLIVKKRQAEIMIDYLELRLSRVGYGNHDGELELLRSFDTERMRYNTKRTNRFLTVEAL